MRKCIINPAPSPNSKCGKFEGNAIFSIYYEIDDIGIFFNYLRSFYLVYFYIPLATLDCQAAMPGNRPEKLFIRISGRWNRKVA